MRYNVQLCPTPFFDASDTRAWRNECWYPDSTARLSDILDGWMDDYIHMRLVGQPRNHGALLHSGRSDDPSHVRQTYISQEKGRRLTYP
jgi:hypothetical protein